MYTTPTKKTILITVLTFTPLLKPRNELFQNNSKLKLACWLLFYSGQKLYGMTPKLAAYMKLERSQYVTGTMKFIDKNLLFKKNSKIPRGARCQGYTSLCPCARVDLVLGL